MQDDVKGRDGSEAFWVPVTLVHAGESGPESGPESGSGSKSRSGSRFN